MDMLIGLSFVVSIICITSGLYLIITNDVDTREKYALPLIGIAIGFIPIGFHLEMPVLYLGTASIFGFLVGFVSGINSIYKAFSGKDINDENLNETLNEIL